MKPFNPEILKAKVENLILRREHLKRIYTKSLMLKQTAQETEGDDFMQKVINVIEANLANEDFSVQMLAYIQMETPAQLTGKVLSWVLTFSLCAQPLGLAFYGTVFEFCATMPYLPLFGAAAAALLLAGAARNVFGRL